MFIFVQFMHCLIYMKRGGKMEQGIEKKSNRKIHIIFAIFTLFLSFGITCIDISATTDSSTIEKYFAEINSAPYCISFKWLDYYEKDNKIVSYERINFYIFEEKPHHFSYQNGHPGNPLYAYDDKGNQIYADYYNVFGIGNNYYNSNGKLKMLKGTSKQSVSLGLYTNEKLETGSVIAHTSINTSTFDVYVDDNLVFQKPTAPVAIVAEQLPEVVGNQTQIIIGGTICFLALMIFLVILVRHFRTVSRGY